MFCSSQWKSFTCQIYTYLFVKYSQVFLFCFVLFFYIDSRVLFICLFVVFFFKSVITFIYITLYTSIPIAQFSTPPSPPHCSFPPLVSIHLFSTSVSQLLPCNPVHLCPFSRFHIHMLISNICFFLSNLLHSV